MSAETPISLNMDIQDLQVQTVTVEKLLEPLIIQVTTLVNCPQNPSNRKKGRSKRARVLLASVEEATWNLLDKGEKIAKEATALKEELTAALQEVRKESNALKVSAERFTDDPCYLPKREAVVQAARALLAAVTRLLILADMIDVMCLLQHVSSFQRTFESLKNVSNKSDLQRTYQKLGKELENLDYLAFKRQQDLKSPSQRDEIAGARATLKENSPLLHSICSACLEHSDVASLKASKDTVCEEIQNALDVISNASQGIQNVPSPSEPQTATLGGALDELQNLIVLNPLTVTEEEIRPSLEKRLEAIISGAALLADSSSTRDLHRERIIAECNAIRQALQDLLSEYMNNAVSRVNMKLNISFLATSCQKLIEVDDERKLRTFYEKLMATEVAADVLGEEWKGYVVGISGGNDKQGFPMKQGILTHGRVRLLLNKWHSCYRPRRTGERKHKSVRGCIVDANLSILNLVIVQKREKRIPGLTDTTVPRRLGPKRASRIRKLFNLSLKKMMSANML